MLFQLKCKRPPQKCQAAEVYKYSVKQGKMKVISIRFQHLMLIIIYGKCWITALQLGTQRLAQIDGGDLIAKEVKYHLKC